MLKRTGHLASFRALKVSGGAEMTQPRPSLCLSAHSLGLVPVVHACRTRPRATNARSGGDSYLHLVVCQEVPDSHSFQHF